MNACRHFGKTEVLLVIASLVGCRGSSPGAAGAPHVDNVAGRRVQSESDGIVASGSAETIVRAAPSVPSEPTPSAEAREDSAATERVAIQDKPVEKAAKPRATAEVVVLVHGMGRTTASMLPLKWALEREGFEVVNWGYRSRAGTVREAGDALGEKVAALERERDGVRVHFVGHSLGNIVIRYLLEHHRPEHAGRVVMLAPPNQGSAKADQLESFAWLVKPLSELTTDEQSTARSIPPPEDVEIGIIAGERDTKVTVEESHLEGETDHVVVSSGHTFIMARPKVHALVVLFLRTGRFAGSGDAQEASPPADTP